MKKNYLSKKETPSSLSLLIISRENKKEKNKSKKKI